jgi:hypothetical protein
MSCNVPSIKKGTTFNAVVTYTPETGWPANLLGYDVKSSVMDSRNVRYALTVTVALDGLSFTCNYPNTNDWHIGTANWDVIWTDGTVSFGSDIQQLTVINNITPNPAS